MWLLKVIMILDIWQTAFSVSNMWLPDMLWHGWPFGNQTCQLETFHLHHLHIHMKELPLCLGIYQPATFDDDMISEGHLPKKIIHQGDGTQLSNINGGIIWFSETPMGSNPQIDGTFSATERSERRFFPGDSRGNLEMNPKICRRKILQFCRYASTMGIASGVGFSFLRSSVNGWRHAKRPLFEPGFPGRLRGWLLA